MQSLKWNWNNQRDLKKMLNCFGVLFISIFLDPDVWHVKCFLNKNLFSTFFLSIFWLIQEFWEQDLNKFIVQ